MEPLPDHLQQTLRTIAQCPGITRSQLSELMKIDAIDAHTRIVLLWQLKQIEVSRDWVNPLCRVSTDIAADRSRLRRLQSQSLREKLGIVAAASKEQAQPVAEPQPIAPVAARVVALKQAKPTTIVLDKPKSVTHDRGDLAKTKDQVVWLLSQIKVATAVQLRAQIGAKAFQAIDQLIDDGVVDRVCRNPVMYRLRG